MDTEGEALGDTERGHQQLREHIAESDRLIGEVQQRLVVSRSITRGAGEQLDASDGS